MSHRKSEIVFEDEKIKQIGDWVFGPTLGQGIENFICKE